MSGFVTVLAWDAANGKFTNVQDARTLASNFIGSSDSAEIAIHPNGKFLYESNRRFRGPNLWGPDTIGVFSIDPVKGTLDRGRTGAARGHHAAQFCTLIPRAHTCFPPMS